MTSKQMHEKLGELITLVTRREEYRAERTTFVFGIICGLYDRLGDEVKAQPGIEKPLEPRQESYWPPEVIQACQTSKQAPRAS